MDISDAQAHVLISDVGNDAFHRDLVHIDDSECKDPLCPCTCTTSACAADFITTISPFAIHARSTDVSHGKGLVIVPTETALVIGTYTSETTPATETIQALYELSTDLVAAGF